MNRANFAGAFAFVLLPSLALANIFQKSGTEKWTEPSGHATALHGDLLTTANYYGLETLALHQYGHSACVLGADESALSTHSRTTLSDVKACEPTGGEQWKQADLGAGKFVTGIATCTGSVGENSIHGVQLWGATLRADGKVVPAAQSVKVELFGCKVWQQKQMCPAGFIATGVRAYWPDATNGMSGLALRCHQVEWRELP